MKPIAYKIDTSIRNAANLPKPGGFGVSYRCPTCGEKFNEFLPYDKINYCYSCGESVFFGGCIEFINSKQSDRLKDPITKEIDPIYEKGLLAFINEENEKSKLGTLVFIEEE